MPFDISRTLSTHKRSSGVQTKIPSSSSTTASTVTSYRPRSSHEEPLRSNTIQPASPQSYRPVPPPGNDPTKPKPTVAPITILPCGCKRNHILISKLSPITECSSHYPGPTSAFSSSSSSPSSPQSRSSTPRTSTPSSLQRSIDMNDYPNPHPQSPSITAFPDFRTPEDTEIEFQFYLPHLSTSTHAIYTDCDWIAFDTLQYDEELDTEALLFSDWSSSNMNIPLIDEDDYNYYPKLERGEVPCPSSTADEDMDLDSFRKLVEEFTSGKSGQQKKNERKERRKLKKKRAREEFWLERKVGGFVGVLGKLRGKRGKGKKG